MVDEMPPVHGSSRRKENTKLGDRLAEQAREKARESDAKAKDFASGKKRFTEGK